MHAHLHDRQHHTNAVGMLSSRIRSLRATKNETAVSRMTRANPVRWQRMTVSVGTDQTTSSMRQYFQPDQQMLFVLEALNQYAEAKIASESIRIVLSAIPIGPGGSGILIAEPRIKSVTRASVDR